MSDQPCRDLFEAVLLAFTDGRPAADTAAEFVRFARSYLTTNPVVTAGYSLGSFTLTLADRRSLPLVAGAVATTGGWSGSIPFGGHQTVSPADRLPDAGDVPFAPPG